MQSDDRIILDERVIQWRRRDLPSRESDNNDASFEGDALRGPTKRLAAYWVEDHIGATTMSDVTNHVNEVLRLPIDNDVGAETPCDITFLFAASDTDYQGS
jgi:hypothetical protein